MEEARRVLERLERIERLEHRGAPSDQLLDELRALVHEAEVWVRAEPATERVAGTVERCRTALATDDAGEVALLAQ